jgi:hypothetical protein
VASGQHAPYALRVIGQLPFSTAIALMTRTKLFALSNTLAERHWP